jgi:hypothetical protein
VTLPAIAAYDGLLRCEGRFAVGRGRVPIEHLALLLLASGSLYGAAMGSGTRATQALYSGIKVPLLLVVSTCVCLPNFFVVNALLGLREDFAASLRGILAAQASVAAGLLALAPLVPVLYLSTDSYRLAVLGNGVCFALATLVGQRILGRHYAPLVAKDRRHAICRWAWMALYVFVAIQLAWVLRPFVGSPGMSTTFFRENAWSNAYVVILRQFLGLDL